MMTFTKQSKIEVALSRINEKVPAPKSATRLVVYQGKFIVEVPVK